MHVGYKTPVCRFEDNKLLFKIISKGSKTSELRLMFGIAPAREAI